MVERLLGRKTGAWVPLAACALALPSVAASPEYALEVGLARGALWNPWTLRNDPVELRSYRGAGISDGAFVGPTMRVRPGDTLRVRIDNRLPPCGPDETHEHGCINETNLHTHGLWVSPAGNSDNVLISIPPGRSFQYEYAIPADHPAGTFWYHPHRHGATTYQVSSGMAGALIVEGGRLPTATTPGDIDILLRDERGRPFPERVLLFQQTNYACRDEKGAVRKTRPDGDDTRPWICPDGEVGRIDARTPFGTRSFWRHTGRFTSINGEVQPELPAQTGRFERWRMIHGGIRERVRMHVRRLDDNAPSLRSVPAVQHEQWIERHCRGPMLPLWEIALDGLTRSEVRETPVALLSPGDRVDVLAYLPEPGRYCMVHQPTRGAGNTPRLLAIVNADSGPRPSTLPSEQLRRLMTRAAERAFRRPDQRPIRERVVEDLRRGMRLTAFAPHRTVLDTELTGRQVAVFKNAPAPQAEVDFTIDDKSYDHRRIDRWLPLGGVEEWHVSAPLLRQTDHQLHIHVNPFQIMSVVDQDGRDVIDSASATHDPDYAGLAGQWRDGLPLKSGYRAVLRTRYERFIGDFVLHCHILLHGDQGMMQNLRIYLPGGSEDPAIAHGHHGN